VRIAALSPQFVVESPPAAEGDDHARLSTHLTSLRLAEAEASSESSASEEDSPEHQAAPLSAETIEGIKRLSQLVRDQRQAPENKSENKLSKVAVKKARALFTYQSLARGSTDPHKGRFIDRFY
jgi:hypothetical protein